MSFIEKHVLKNFVIFCISLNGYHFRGNSSIKNSLEDDAPSCIWKSEYSQRKIFWDIEKKNNVLFYVSLKTFWDGFFNITSGKTQFLFMLYSFLLVCSWMLSQMFPDFFLDSYFSENHRWIDSVLSRSCLVSEFA